MKMLERHYEVLTKSILSTRHEIQAVEITPAAKWFFEENDQEVWESREDFPTLVPPFTWTWLEFEVPKFSNDSGKHTLMPTEARRVGCMIFRSEIREEYQREIVLKDVAGEALLYDLQSASGSPVKRAHRTPDQQAVINREVEKEGGAVWWILMKSYVESSNGAVHDLPMASIYLSGTGKPFSYEAYIGGSMHMSLYETVGNIGAWLLPFRFAISLMHAKNVKATDLELPERLAKKRAKQGKPALKFKTLVIEPLRHATNSGRGTGASGIHRALHFVRGHFKDFREHGLFGRHKDIYWWDMHARGNESAGKVIKDYAITR